MKYLLLIICIASLSTNANAKIWRINNNAGVVADFTGPDAAVASVTVMDNDTLYFESSANVYNGFTLDKKLVLIGLGYFINGSPSNANLQANLHEAVLSSLTIDTLGSGSQIIGLKVGAVYINSSGAGADNITFTRCSLTLFGGTATPPVGFKAQNWIVNKCWLVQIVGYAINPENWQITNCIITQTFFFNSPNTLNCLIRNNVITATSGINILNVYFANNIIPGSAITSSNCTIKNNTSTSSAFTDPLDLANGNNNVPFANVFVAATNASIDNYYQLKPGYENSANADGETVNGVTPKRGAFATADPYRLSGIPNIPSIYTLTAPASVASTATTMPVTISSKSNN